MTNIAITEGRAIKINYTIIKVVVTTKRKVAIEARSSPDDLK